MKPSSLCFLCIASILALTARQAAALTCTTDADCAGAVPPDGLACIGGWCSCSDSGQCASGYLCDVMSGLGCQAAPCTDDSSCAGSELGSACIEGGHCGCRSSEDCAAAPAGTRCGDEGRCVCADSSECMADPDGHACLPSGICACVDDADCDPGRICIGVCSEAHCASEGDCTGNPMGPRCLEGICGCSDPGDCGPEMTCSPDGHFCVSGCSSDADCPNAVGAGLRCESMACVCRGDADCPNDDGIPRTCIGGSCGLLGCSVDADCPDLEGRIGVCVAGSCLAREPRDAGGGCSVGSGTSAHRSGLLVLAAASAVVAGRCRRRRSWHSAS